MRGLAAVREQAGLALLAACGGTASPTAAAKVAEATKPAAGATTAAAPTTAAAAAPAKDPSADLVSADVPFVPEFAAAGWTIPVEDVLPKDERGKFFKGTIEGATYEGTLYGVLAGGHRPAGEGGVGVVGRRQHDQVDAAAIEQLVQRGIGRHAVVLLGPPPARRVAAGDGRQAQLRHPVDQVGVEAAAGEAIADDANARHGPSLRPASQPGLT